VIELVTKKAKMKSKSTRSLNSSLLIDLEAAKGKIVGNSLEGNCETKAA
jgi:hypothetical protein